MNDREFEIGGRKFKLSKIDAFKQFHIARRISPLLADLLPAMAEIQKVDKKSEAEMNEAQKFEEFAKIVTPLMHGLAKLSDEDSNRILFGLLAAAEVQQAAGNWTKIANDSMLMIQDIELPAMLQIAGRAFMFNLSGFFGALPRK